MEFQNIGVDQLQNVVHVRIVLEHFLILLKKRYILADVLVRFKQCIKSFCVCACDLPGRGSVQVHSLSLGWAHLKQVLNRTLDFVSTTGHH